MKSVRETATSKLAGPTTPTTPGMTGSEWDAAPLRPVAHWVTMPDASGGTRLGMVWEVPDPLPPGRTV